jgi:hypothetical protein
LFDNASGVVTVDAVSCGTMTEVSETGENLYTNIYTLGTIEQHTNEEQIYIEQAGSRIFSGSEWWPENKTTSAVRHIDVLVKVKEMDVVIGSGLVTVYLRNYPTTGDADLYDHFGIALSNGGRNAVPLSISVDLNNTSPQNTVDDYSDIEIAFVNGTLTYSAISGSFTEFEIVQQATTNASGLFLEQTTATGSGTMTLGNVVGTFNNSATITGTESSETAASSSTLTEIYKIGKEFEQQAAGPEYSVIIGCASRRLSQVYEYLKYVTRIGSTFAMYPTTYPQGGPLSHTSKQGQLYISAHVDSQTSPTNNYAPVKASPFGTFAGGTFFGAQGVWIQTMSSLDVKNYQLIDASGSTQSPPNQQAITISNLISGDRVSVFRTSGGTTINKSMYTADANNTTGNTTFIVNETIAADTPSAGTIRIVDGSNTTSARETRYTYASWATKTFSGLTPSLDRTYTQTEDAAYIPFIDQLVESGSAETTTSISVTVIYTTDRTIIVRVRRKAATAILPFEITDTFRSTGFSTSAIRTTDSIVQ